MQCLPKISLNSEDYKTVLKVLRRPKLKDTPCSWIRRLNVVKMKILLKLICRFNIPPIKILFCRNLSAEIKLKHQIENASNQEEPKQFWKNSVAGLTYDNFKT